MTTTNTKQSEARRQVESALNEEFGSLVGRTVTQVRLLTQRECDDLYWTSGPWDMPFVLIFDDGTAAVVSQDPEGNGPGWLLLADTVPAK